MDNVSIRRRRKCHRSLAASLEVIQVPNDNRSPSGKVCATKVILANKRIKIPQKAGRITCLSFAASHLCCSPLVLLPSHRSRSFAPHGIFDFDVGRHRGGRAREPEKDERSRCRFAEAVRGREEGGSPAAAGEHRQLPVLNLAVRGSRWLQSSCLRIPKLPAPRPFGPRMNPAPW